MKKKFMLSINLERIQKFLKWGSLSLKNWFYWKQEKLYILSENGFNFQKEKIETLILKAIRFENGLDHFAKNTIRRAFGYFKN